MQGILQMQQHEGLSCKEARWKVLGRTVTAHCDLRRWAPPLQVACPVCSNVELLTDSIIVNPPAAFTTSLSGRSMSFFVAQHLCTIQEANYKRIPDVACVNLTLTVFKKWVPLTGNLSRMYHSSCLGRFIISSIESESEVELAIQSEVVKSQEWEYHLGRQCLDIPLYYVVSTCLPAGSFKAMLSLHVVHQTSLMAKDKVMTLLGSV